MDEINKISPDRIVGINIGIGPDTVHQFNSYQYEDDIYTITEIRHKDLTISIKTLEDKDSE